MMLVQRRIALVADCHELFRIGLADLISKRLGFHHVLKTACFGEALNCLAANNTASLAIFDRTLLGADCVPALQRVRRTWPTLPVAVITDTMRRHDLLQVLAAGAQGYAPKTLGAAELAEGLEAVLSRRLFVPSTLLDEDEGPGDEVEAPTPGADLTPRQRQVVRLIAQGKSNKEIARALRLAEGTIKVHVNALYRTLSVRNRAGAVAAISQYGWQRAS